MIYITADRHGDLSRTSYFAQSKPISPEDIMIVLDDADLDYYADKKEVGNPTSFIVF